MAEQIPRDPGILAGLDLAGFRAVAAILRDGVLLLDRTLKIRDLNPAAERILGRSAETLRGLSICSLFGEQDCPRDTLADSLRGGRPILDFQTTVRLPAGRRGQVLLRTTPVDLRHRGVAMAMLIGDVTEETRLRRQSQQRDGLGGLVGKDPRLRELFALIEQVAPSEASVLIRGESGTGKELVARALHDRSRRSAGPFVSVNCSALAETLLESELFGHVRGAFTGAAADRQGRFEAAQGGTLFLDEIGDLSQVVQVKLLRVLQERVIERVGANRPVPVDVRVISATNRDLEAMLADGRLREDFYYRIKVVRLDLPPLRQRREDIPLLASHLLAKHGHAEVAIAPEALARLMRHDWPGNVRELENALEHAMVLSTGGSLRGEHLPPEIGAGRTPGNRAGLRDVPSGSSQERELLLAALRQTGWHRSRAARQLGIDRTTLWRKLKEHGLKPAR